MNCATEMNPPPVPMPEPLPEPTPEPVPDPEPLPKPGEPITRGGDPK